MELVTVSEPENEPVTIAETVNHLRVDITADYELINALIVAARIVFEDTNGRGLFTTTHKLILDDWPKEHFVRLPKPPLQSVTSITYKDSLGNTTTLSTLDYVVNVNSTPGLIMLATNATWPTVELYPTGAIEITYLSGYTTTGAIPQTYKQAMLMLIGHWYEQRETALVNGAVPKELPFAFTALAKIDRVWL